MGYGGYLVKFGNYTIPNNLIKQDTFSSYVNMQDKDPWTDENGYEHRDAVELKALKVEFETKAMLTEKQFDDFWKNIEKNYTKAMERGVKQRGNVAAGKNEPVTIDPIWMLGVGG